MATIQFELITGLSLGFELVPPFELDDGDEEDQFTSLIIDLFLLRILIQW